MGAIRGRAAVDSRKALNEGELLPLSKRENPGSRLATPWGEASELKERRLYPGAGTPSGEVARNQRERLFGAMVALVSTKGYEAITVADVLELSGVSRSAFYEHFANKGECLTAAVSALVEQALAEIEPGGRFDGRERADRAFEDFFALLAAQPAAARAYFVELHAVGEPGDAVGDHAVAAVAERVEAMGAVPDWDLPTNPAILRALIAGSSKIVHSRLARGDEGTLAGLAPQLWEWLTAIADPPRPLAVPRRQRAGPGGRFEGYTPAERIARAVAVVIAEKGYAAMSTADVAAKASISLSTFYANFADKRDAVLSALEMGGAQVMALAVPSARRADGWAQSVRALYETICAYFAAEPAMAHLALIGVYAAGPEALAHRDRVIDSLAAMLGPGFEENPAAPAASKEAIGATVYALMREQLRRGGAESLATVVPLATYVTLVGFAGPDRAAAVANGERASKR
jgi:AcrR family transcriptional regulator